MVRRTTRDGHQIGFQYDRIGRLVRTSYPGRVVSLGYDASGNLVRAEDQAGAVTAEYDALDRVVAVKSPAGHWVSYEYDPWGRTSAVTPSGGSRVEYERDAAGRIVTIATTGGLITFDYAPNQIIRTLPNRIRTTFSWGPLGLVSLRHQWPDGGLIAEYCYTRDSAGRVQEIQESTGSGSRIVRFVYDLSGRLVSETDSKDGSATWSYDPEQNRVSETRNGTRIFYSWSKGKATDGVRLRYDDAGELRERDAETKAHYTFDTSGRLISVQRDGRKTEYAYDALNCRLSRTVNGHKTVFLQDVSSGRPKVTAEYSAEGKIMRQYIRAGGPLGVISASGAVSYFLEDHLGSTRYIVDNGGRVISAFDYSAFGVPRSVTGDGPRFGGQEWDSETSLLFLGSRYMDPRDARFLSRDPFPPSLRHPQTFNRYVYAGNDPVNLTDPTGLAPQPRPEDSKYEPTFVREQQQWWQDWAVRQLGADHNGPVGMAKAALGSIEYAFLEHYASPIERGIRELADPGYAAAHPIARYLTGIKLASDVAGLVPIEAAPSSLKINFSESAGALDRIKILNTGNTWAETRTYLPFGLDKLYPGSNSLRFSLNEAKDLVDLGTESLDFGKEVRPFSETDQPQSKPVGGVRLNQRAEWPSDLGPLTGAWIDSKSGSLVLAGEKCTSLPALRASDLAVALRAAVSGAEISMSIDPDPHDPNGPTMKVRFFGGTAHTRLGHVMFECDRLMKGLTVGRDNITKQPLRAPFPHFQNMAERGLATRAAPNGLWSRFWLVPDRVVLGRSSDGREIVFKETRMRVKTETMRWEGHKLVSGGNMKDESAEATAASLTAHYDELARQYPVFEELRQMARIAALAHWMKESGFAPDSRWIERNSGETVETPDTTPSVLNSLSQRSVRSTRTIRIFGGAVLTSHPEFEEATEAQEFASAVSKAHASSSSAVFNVSIGRKPLRAVSIATQASRLEGTFLTSQRGPLGLNLYYNSFHRGWSLLLPRLYAEGPIRRVSAPGLAQQMLPLDYFLTDEFGIRNEKFQDVFVDTELGRLGMRSLNKTYRGAFLQPDRSVVLLLTGGGAWRFDAGGKPIEFVGRNGPVQIEYGAAAAAFPKQIKAEGHSARFIWSDGQLASIQTDSGEQFRYVWHAGNLETATSPGHSTRYRYDSGGLLEAIDRDGARALSISFDAAGRWTRQADGNGNVLCEQSFSDEAITRSEPGGARTTSSYYADGTLRLAVVDDGNGRRSAEWTRDHKYLKVIDGRGNNKEFFFDDGGRLEESKINGTLFATYRYGSGLRISAYKGFQMEEEFGRDGERKAVRVLPERTWKRPEGSHVEREIRFASGQRTPALLTRQSESLPAETAGCKYQFDRSGRISEVRLAGGTKIDYRYDTQGRLAEVVEERWF
jgi:RHS repeat-associated protein